MQRIVVSLVACLFLVGTAPQTLAQPAGDRAQRLQEWRAMAVELGLTEAQRKELQQVFRGRPGPIGSHEFRAAIDAVLTSDQRERLAAFRDRNVPDEPRPDVEMEVHKDLAYASREGADAGATSLDLYVPKTPGPHPIVAYIHGGGWRKGDKEAVHLKPAFFLGEGMLFASLNYRLIPETSEGAVPLRRIAPNAEDYASQMQDLAAGIAWLCQHAGEYNGDPERVYVVGHSAGAHLAALLATDHRYLRDTGVNPAALRGAITLDGGGLDIARQITELATLLNRGLYRNIFGEEPEHWHAASPITYVKADAPIPPFLLMPIAMRDETRAQAQGFAEALRKAGHDATVHIAEGKTHGSLNQELGTPDDATTLAVKAFLRNCEERAAP